MLIFFPDCYSLWYIVQRMYMCYFKKNCDISDQLKQCPTLRIYLAASRVFIVSIGTFWTQLVITIFIEVCIQPLFRLLNFVMSDKFC